MTEIIPPLLMIMTTMMMIYHAASMDSRGLVLLFDSAKRDWASHTHTQRARHDPGSQLSGTAISSYSTLLFPAPLKSHGVFPARNIHRPVVVWWHPGEENR